jgi:hypothetical protein
MPGASHETRLLLKHAQARVAALGFGELAAYLRVRRIEQGLPLARIQAELGVGRRWLRAQLDTHGPSEESTPVTGG